MKLTPLSTLLALALGAGAAGAHHSIAAFDGSRTMRLTGVVTGFRWINPHVSVEIDAAGEGDAPARWTVEMTAPNSLMDEGWKRDTLSVGDRITVFAHPLRDPAPGVHRGLYAGIILADGRTLGRVDAGGHAGEQ